MIRVSIVAAAALIAVSCSTPDEASPEDALIDAEPGVDDAATAPEPDDEPEPEPGPQDAANAFIDALARERYADMVSVATGPARLYAEYLTAIQRADVHILSGTTMTVVRRPASPEELEGDRIRLDAEVRSSDAESDDIVFTEFVVVDSQDGWLVETFTRDGEPLNRFVADVSEVAPADVNAVLVTPRHLFRNLQTDFLAVIVEVANNRDNPIDVFHWNATFVSTEGGRQYSAVDGVSPSSDLQAGARTDVVVFFAPVADAGAGGTLRVEMSDSSTFDPFAASLELPPFE